MSQRCNLTLACLPQTVEFGLRGERVPRAKILAEFLSAHFQENPTKSAQNLMTKSFVSYVLGLAK
jgi:hypothetical protein